MIKKSTTVAMGGVSSALCLLFMFLTGVFPFATFALPAIAGMILISVVVENGYKVATTVYFAVSILSVFIVPDREAAMMFVGFFGYYSILKGKIDKIKSKLLKIGVKFAVFNTAVIAVYTIIIKVLGMTDILEEMSTFGEYTLLIMLLMGNVVFVVYDIALSRVAVAYIYWFRPKFLRKF
ncbi:MAG: hypothetical protein RR048_05945 [Oscillospiraceae bacterium]